MAKKRRRGAARRASTRKRSAIRKRAPSRASLSSFVLNPFASDLARLRLSSTFNIGAIYDAISPRLPEEFRVRARRPDDLLVFDVVFENLEREGQTLKKKDASAPAYLIIEFPPQSFGEEAFLEASTSMDDPKNSLESDPVPPLPSSRVRMAGRSRVVLSMPPDVLILPYTLDGVLDALRTWPMRLDVNAAPDAPEKADRPWLVAITNSSSWQGLQMTFASAFAAVSPQVQGAVQKSARRIAERAAAGLKSGVNEDLRTVLLEMMRNETDQLAQRFPVLREGNLRDAGVAWLSLQATQALASSPQAPRFGIDAAAYLPFLPLLFSPHEPARTVTALELPYRVILSPLEPARWLHRDKPVEHHDRVELWHTRLTNDTEDLGPDAPSMVRAIWSPDYPLEEGDLTDLLGPPELPFRMSLNAEDRKWLVQVMGDFTQQKADGSVYTPRASEAKRLHLSALGSLLDVEGSWDPRPAGVDLEQWRHIAALGRDQYVRVVTAGYLCCFGHAASLVKVTERKFESLDGDLKKRIAVLRQRFFIVVRQRLKQYSPQDHQYLGRNFPFTSVEILTRVTPNLLTPGAGKSALGLSGNPVDPRSVFWPMVPGTTSDNPVDFRLDIAATDLAGNRVTFSMPLLFVSESRNLDRITDIKAAYNASDADEKRSDDLGNATVCYTQFDGSENGDPRLPTARMSFRAGDLRPGLNPFFAPRFYPETEHAEVGIRSVQKMLGLANFTVPMTFTDAYKTGGFDPTANAGQLFLRAVQGRALEFGGGDGQAKSDALGALASPQMTVMGLSKLMGPVSCKPPAIPTDVEQALQGIQNNKFDPKDFFKDANILGGISLGAILDVAQSLAGADVPKLLSQELPDRIEASFDWATKITHSDPLNLIIPKADDSNDTNFVMNGKITTPLANPAAASYSATATIDNFKVNLFGCIILWFDSLKFEAKKGQKPDVTVSLHGEDAVKFGGPLEFVNELRSLIPSNGFSDPPSLSVTPSGISAGYSLTLPTIGVGIFSLSNASLGAGFNLPFDSKPMSVKFNFSEREHPFSLTVSLLGGGGFFAIGISSRGVNEIEAALEFGAAIQIDLGVASGGVEIKAGVYFHWLEPIPNKGSVELAGYVRIHGELSVLAIISISLTFNLQLGYQKAGGQATAYGEATLVVEVEVLFFSADVSVRCRREFGGSASDPKFLKLMPTQGKWAEYCGAFAAEAA